MRPAAGLLWPRVSSGAPSPGPGAPSSPHPLPGTGEQRGSPAPPPQRSMPTNKCPLPPPPSPLRAPFFEPDANLTHTSIIRSALSKLVVSSPAFPGAPDSTSLLPPYPHPRYPPGSTGKARSSRTGPAKLTGRFRPGPRPPARTHTARTQPTPPGNQPCRLTALYTHPRAGRPT